MKVPLPLLKRRLHDGKACLADNLAVSRGCFLSIYPESDSVSVVVVKDRGKKVVCEIFSRKQFYAFSASAFENFLKAV